MPDSTSLVEAIEAYLAAHPLATDSAEGVARWWLGPLSGRASLEEVELALATLVRRRRLSRVGLADGKALYRSAARDIQ